MEQDTQRKLEEAISLLASIDNSNKLSWKSVFNRFALGIASALGATLGLAIFITLVTFVVHALGGIPLVGVWFSSLGNFLQSNHF